MSFQDVDDYFPRILLLSLNCPAFFGDVVVFRCFLHNFGFSVFYPLRLAATLASLSLYVTHCSYVENRHIHIDSSQGYTAKVKATENVHFNVSLHFRTLTVLYRAVNARKTPHRLSDLKQQK